MNAQAALVPRADQAQITAPLVQEPSIAMMLHSFIERGVTSENVQALTQLCNLHERMQDKAAEREFATAFAKLQEELPTVAATKTVYNKDNTPRYVFAPYEEIMATLKPLLARHGFSVSFDSSFGEGRITVICTLTHRAGHSRKNSFAVRIGQGPPGASETQADGAAKQYGKRGALCDALNIVVDHDDDGRALGDNVTPEQAAELKLRVEKAGVDVDKFLKYAGALDFETIPAESFDRLDELLARKELQK